MPGRTQRIDFQATSDPALMASADRGESRLLDHRQLYRLWERRHRATQDLDFAQRRIDWHEPWIAGDDVEFMGASVNQTRAFALKALERRLKVIGLVAAA